MEYTLFQQLIEQIIDTLEKTGYNSREQLMEYLKTGDLTYITRQNNARTIIQQLDKGAIYSYIEMRYAPKDRWIAFLSIFELVYRIIE